MFVKVQYDFFFLLYQRVSMETIEGSLIKCLCPDVWGPTKPQQTGANLYLKEHFTEILEF